MTSFNVSCVVPNAKCLKDTGHSLLVSWRIYLLEVPKEFIDENSEVRDDFEHRSGCLVVSAEWAENARLREKWLAADLIEMAKGKPT